MFANWFIFFNIPLNVINFIFLIGNSFFYGSTFNRVPVIDTDKSRRQLRLYYSNCPRAGPRAMFQPQDAISIKECRFYNFSKEQSSMKIASNIFYLTKRSINGSDPNRKFYFLQVICSLLNTVLFNFSLFKNLDLYIFILQNFLFTTNLMKHYKLIDFYLSKTIEFHKMKSTFLNVTPR